MRNKYRLFVLLFCGVGLMLYLVLQPFTQVVNSQSANYAMRFYGTGSNDIDRVKVDLRTTAGAAANVGNTDFTIEWWMKGLLSNNASGTCTSGGDNWINGNVIVDRDVYFAGDFGDYGISVYGGRIAFGVANSSTSTTICGTINVLDNAWHHVAVTRSSATGEMRIFVDGVLAGQGNGPAGDIRYNVGRSTNFPNSDPFLVLGAEKHDAGSNYPSYNGLMDEFRISNTIRYSSNFSRPTQPFATDANTRVLYRFNEGSGTTLQDASGNNVTAQVKVGGPSAGPVYVSNDLPPLAGTSSSTTSLTTTSQSSTTSVPTCLPADINRDNIVDISDYSILVANFFQTTPTNPRADVNSDGIVDISDYSILVTNFFVSPTGCTVSSSTSSSTSSVSSTTSSSTSTPAVLSNEWTQHAMDAQRTSFNPQSIPAPWRWEWAWNGPTSTGGVAKVTSSNRLPRNVQPVTGNNRVYVAAGSDGVYALNITNGSQLWKVSPGGAINSTVAYAVINGQQVVFAVSANGNLYKLNAENGQTIGTFASTSGTSTYPLPPAVHGNRVYYSMGTAVYAVDAVNMSQIWKYSAASGLHTPPAYSAAKDLVVATSGDLIVHGINASGTNAGTARWTRNITSLTGVVPGNPSTAGGTAELYYGWPVIAEVHGLALIKLRLDWGTLWDLGQWPTTNAQIRSALTGNKSQQALIVLDLNNGNQPFIANIGHGGWGDNNFMPMGPQPVVKKFADNTEVVYTVIRGDNRFDARWDSHYGEMVLDDSTVPGLQAGYVRWIQYGNFGWPANSNHDNHPTDEQVFVTMAGNQLFGAHWAMYDALTVVDRSAARGSYTAPITSTALPHVVSVTNSTTCNRATPNSSHMCNGATILTADGEYRAVPNNGFYMYWNAGKIYDTYWSGYSEWIPTKDYLLLRTNDGAIIAFKSGNPLAQGTGEEPGGVVAGVADLGGENVSRSFKIGLVHNNGKAVLISEQNPHVGQFKIIVPKQYWLRVFGKQNILLGRNTLGNYQEGQTISVTGKGAWYQGDKVVYVDSPEQLKLLQ